jgi:hypothetical protein
MAIIEVTKACKPAVVQIDVTEHREIPDSLFAYEKPALNHCESSVWQNAFAPQS